MAGKSSLVILNEFLDKKEILINAEKFLEKNLVKSKDYTELSENIVEQIVVDAYDGHGENVKKISQKIVNDFGIYLGRIQKKQIKQYLDYQNNSDFKELVRLIGEEIGDSEIGIREICDDVIEKHQKIITDTVKDFSEKIKTAQKEKKWRRVTDYLNFIYSRLVTKNEDREIHIKKTICNCWTL